MSSFTPPALLVPIASAALIIVTAMRWGPTAVRTSLAPRTSTCAGPQRGLTPSALAALTERLGRASRRRWPHRGDRSVRPDSVAAWADDVARSMRRGDTLRESLVSVRALDGELDRATGALRHHLERGATVAAASHRWSDGLDDADDLATRHVAAAAAVISVAAQVGGGAGEPLDRLAAAMRQFAADDLEREAQSAQARLSARVLTFVPIAVLGLLLVADDDVRTVITSPPGAAVVGLGLGLNSIGSFWMRRIIARSTA